MTKGVGATGAPVYTHNPVVVANPSVGITVTQNLYDGFQTANRVRRAETNTSAAREALRVAEQTVH